MNDSVQIPKQITSDQANKIGIPTWMYEKVVNWFEKLTGSNDLTPHPGLPIGEMVVYGGSSEEAKTVVNTIETSQDPMSILVEAIEVALQCTPNIKYPKHGHLKDAKIVYDCGNPWDILRDALERTKGEDPGGQDRKYKFENGQFVNRVSGEPIPKDEPTFILRARDFHSLALLKDYLFLIHDEHHKKAVQDRIGEFEQFAIDHPERMKEPGISRHMELNDDNNSTLGSVDAQGYGPL